jgi:lysozyme family protein
MGSHQCGHAWEAAYRHYGHIWEPAAARKMAAASWAVASAWRQIEAATTLPWWAVAAIESAAAAFEEQARKYEGGDDSESHGHDR